MKQTQKTDDTEMLTDIYKNCKMGVESTSKLMPGVQNADMRRIMGEHLKQYQSFAARAADLLAKQNVHIAGTLSRELKHVTLQDEYGPVTFWMMPYL